MGKPILLFAYHWIKIPFPNIRNFLFKICKIVWIVIFVFFKLKYYETLSFILFLIITPKHIRSTYYNMNKNNTFLFYVFYQTCCKNVYHKFNLIKPRTYILKRQILHYTTQLFTHLSLSIIESTTFRSIGQLTYYQTISHLMNLINLY